MLDGEGDQPSVLFLSAQNSYLTVGLGTLETKICLILHAAGSANVDRRIVAVKKIGREVVMRFECGTRILRVIHRRDARATSPTASLLGRDGLFAAA